MTTVRQQLIIDMANALKQEDVGMERSEELAIILAAVIQNSLGMTNDMMDIDTDQLSEIRKEVENIK